MQTFDFSGDPVTDNPLWAPPDLPDGTPGPLETALATIKFGDVGNPNAFLSAVFAGHPDLPGLAAQTAEFVWQGFVFDAEVKADRPGKFFIVSPYSIADKAAAGAYGKGLGDANVGTPCVLVAEIDENPDGSALSLAAQCRRIDAATALGLPPPSAVCLSGGKSVHAFWAVAGMTAGDRAALEAGLLAVLGADPSVGNPGRKMRLGGYRDPLNGRAQTILSLHGTPTTPVDVRAGLDAVAHAWGMADAPASILAARTAARAARKGHAAGGSRPSKAGRVANWDPATVQVGLASGVTAYAADLPAGRHPCRCPYHRDTTPSAVIFVDSRRTSLYCSTCGTTWQPMAPSVYAPHGRRPLADRRSIDLPYVPKMARLSDGILMLRSARGTGKTTAVVAGIRAELVTDPSRRAIVIVHRRALVAKYLHDLDGLGFVGMPERGPIIGDRVVVCLDSLPRVPLLATDGTEHAGDLPPLPWHVCFIDEIEQVIGHLDAESLRRNTTPERVVWALTTTLGVADKVVLADADLGDLTRDFLKLIAPLRDSGTVINTYKPERAALLYSHQTGVESALWAAWAAGKRVAVACTTKANATRIAERLSGLAADRKVVCVTSDTSSGYQDLIANPDSWTVEHQPDALVYSPSLGTGVDVSLRDYWDSVFVVADTGPWTDVYAILQASERVRNPKDMVRHVWIRDGELYGPADPATLRRSYVGTAVDELASAKGFGLLPIGPGLWRTTICEMTREIIILARAARARAQGRMRADATHLMVDAGWQLSWEADDLDDIAKKQISAERKVVKDRYISDVVTAPAMDPEAARIVMRAGAPWAGPCGRAAALRAVLADKFGLPPDADLVRGWLYGGLAAQVRTYGLYRLLAAGHPADAVADAVGWHMTRLAETSSVSQVLSRLRDFVDVMGRYAVTLDSGIISITNDSQILCHRVNSGNVKETTREDGVKLAYGGITQTRRRSKVGGITTVLGYSIDQASVNRMNRLTARWLERRLGGAHGQASLDATVAALLNS